ncbi:hypothetical protein ABI59_15415 [Acidobacteria bacterium Mor1]|nr:hypothetical protein ABI59_15415 [Acidobacteria bacterium Mor1]
MRYLTLITFAAALLLAGPAFAEDTTLNKHKENTLRDGQGQSIGDDSDPISRWLSMGPINPDKLFVPIGDFWHELLEELGRRQEEEEEDEDEPESFGFVGNGKGNGGGRTVI